MACWVGTKNFITIICGGGKPSPQTLTPDQHHNHRTTTVQLPSVRVHVTVSLAFIFWGYGTVSVDTSLIKSLHVGVKIM